MDTSDITHYKYNERNFNHQIQDLNELSQFDKIFIEKWSAVEQNNVFRYSVKSQQYKVLEGQYGFYALLNTQRATMRRTPEEIMSMEQPFDCNKFNFTKISQKEILFDIGDGQGNDVIAVNISPILWSHSLLLTQRFNGLPQNVTLYSLQKAVEVILLSKSINMRVLFNSLCANASVNHLHWHLYYLDHRMLLEWIPVQSFIDSVYILEGFPAKGFCIMLSSFEDRDINKYVSHAYTVISCLQKNKIAHNIYITRSTSDPERKNYDDVRIYIWARSSSYGAKNTEDFIIAACECFGHLIIRTTEAYERINEEYVSGCLQDITTKEFSLAQQKIAETLSEMKKEKQ
ncbi:GDP-D-glucose phosphorylase 1 [Copidosoma floridanum]|uniref:GDP-D-glucose phosphorylase 1 n=1 Tax=Copidosoma floridanum TaxID=29053 RepID=UPI0006C9B7F4|nr:GDP-D-glucose phosphorylase 1 [Copidosoma floridanum]